MGLGDQFSHDDEEQSESSGDSSVAYIYLRSDRNREAFNLMSDKEGGNAELRSWFKNMLPDAVTKNQHTFIEDFLIALDSVRADDDYNDVLEFLMVGAEEIDAYLEDNPEIESELAALRQGTTPDEDEEEAAAPADD